MPDTPVGLIILDGWGIGDREAFNAPSLGQHPEL